MSPPRPRVLLAGQGDQSTSGKVRDRFIIDGGDTEQRFSVVQHLFDPHGLAAPMHRHHLEDEYTYVLSGRIGAVLEGHEVEAGPGDLLFKPRGQWHTFWNAHDEPAAVLEFISPAGLEKFFRWLMDNQDADPEALGAAAAPYHCDVDPDATRDLLERIDAEF
ncbi:MAG TPA: cupin domain-containing protein [Nocardioidaceae bacterium]|nr:cupin domain-containing protein [Nocardioidaceae bacterium]